MIAREYGVLNNFPTLFIEQIRVYEYKLPSYVETNRFAKDEMRISLVGIIDGDWWRRGRKYDDHLVFRILICPTVYTYE